MSTTNQIGPHLLGRRHTPDERDYQLDDILDEFAPYRTLGINEDTSLGGLHESGVVTYLAWLRAWHTYRDLFAATPPAEPTTTSTPPWLGGPILDQGQTGHCVGFGWAAWGDATPITDTYQNPDGDAIYYEAKQMDGEPGAENGSTVRSGAKAMQQRGRLNTYAFTQNIDTVRQWLDQHGPIVIGSDWTNHMFKPQNGYVKPVGPVAGGHCYLALNDDPAENSIILQNSWGTSWGQGGRFRLHYTDLQTLLTGIDYPGEACAALELPLP